MNTLALIGEYGALVWIVYASAVAIASEVVKHTDTTKDDEVISKLNRFSPTLKRLLNVVARNPKK